MRLPYLDSVRGVAALIVMTAHLHQVALRDTRLFELDGFRIFNASGFAVSIFFVLSGLVLFLQFEGERISYPAFVIRRAFRIAPACFFVITLSGAIYYFWAPAAVPALGSWFNDVCWPAGISFDQFLRHFMLNGEVSLLRQMWSLVVEWNVSLVFPIIALLMIYFPRLVCMAAGVVALLLSGPLEWTTNNPFPYAVYTNSAFYASFFVAGAFVASNRISIVEFFEKWKLLRLALLATCIYWVMLRAAPGGFVGWLQHGIIGTSLIVFCMSDPTARRLLSMKWSIYLGRISYSLFLIHIIWVGVLFRVMDGMNPLLIAASVMVVSIASADLLHRFVEVPMNRLGKVIARSIDTYIMMLKVSASR